MILTPNGRCPGPEARPRGAKSPLVERREACALRGHLRKFAQACLRRKRARAGRRGYSVAPLGAPLPRMWRGKKIAVGVPGASNNTGDEACAQFSNVMRGLDPRIHDEVQHMRTLRKIFHFRTSSWIAGSSPAMTMQRGLDRAETRSSFINLPRLYSSCRRKPDMAINGRCNKPFGPGGSTRRLHPSPASTGFGGGELGSTRA